jgi:NADH-quinone oxidoreductase subunit N
MNFLANTEFSLALPELTLLISALVLMLYGAFRGARATGGITLLAIGAMLWAAYQVMHVSVAGDAPDDAQFAFSNMFVVDDFSQFVKFLILISSSLVLGMSFDWLAHEKYKKFEYPILVLLGTLGMMVMVSANDLMMLYVGIELSSLTLYVLASFDRDHAASSEAGIKYFVLGALASGIMLFGASLVYGFAGSTNFSTLAELFTESGVAYGTIVGLVMLVVSLSFKISAVPFHMWTPDVYQGAPTPVTMLFATGPKLAAIAVFIRLLMQPFANLLPDWQMILAIISVASMMIGAFGALTQTNIKRLLAYGSIGHIGYMLIGVTTGSSEGIKAVLVYNALYLFMSIGTFGFVLFMRRAGEQVEDLRDLSGLSKTNPRAAFFMMLMMLSMAGIPPFAGFYGKMFVFLSAIESELYSLAVIGVLTSVVAAFYYLKVIKLMYFDEPHLGIERYVPLVSRITLTICALVTVLFFLYPSVLLDAASQAVGVFQ